MHNYPSDITREQFEIIRSDLESAKKRTRPRKYNLYDNYFTVWTKTDETGNSILDKV